MDGKNMVVSKNVYDITLGCFIGKKFKGGPEGYPTPQDGYPGSYYLKHNGNYVGKVQFVVGVGGGIDLEASTFEDENKQRITLASLNLFNDLI